MRFGGKMPSAEGKRLGPTPGDSCRKPDTTDRRPHPWLRRLCGPAVVRGVDCRLCDRDAQLQLRANRLLDQT
jgi:hypothetical protein